VVATGPTVLLPLGIEARIKRPCFARFPHRIKGQQIAFFTINLNLYSLHSKADKWEGYNILAWVMDEADAFQTASGHGNADRIHEVLRSSSLSRFPDQRWVGFIISYPRSEIGFMVDYVDKMKKNNGAYVDEGATWEIHPFYDPTHPSYKGFPLVQAVEGWVVPEPFAQDFKNDVTSASMTYACKPPPVEGAFFEYPDLLDHCVKENLPVALWAQPSVTTRVVEETGEAQPFTALYIVKRNKQAQDTRYYLHGDPGETKDAFSLCLAHTLPDMEYIETMGQSATFNHVEVDLLLEWVPRHNQPVDYLNVKDVIIQICTWFPVLQVSFDKFQSAQIYQELLELGINARQMSFSRAQQLQIYEAFKILVYNKLIGWPKAIWPELRPQPPGVFSMSRRP
jgi:hypothetical protein